MKKELAIRELRKKREKWARLASRGEETQKREKKERLKVSSRVKKGWLQGELDGKRAGHFFRVKEEKGSEHPRQEASRGGLFPFL